MQIYMREGTMKGEDRRLLFSFCLMFVACLLFMMITSLSREKRSRANRGMSVSQGDNMAPTRGWLDRRQAAAGQQPLVNQSWSRGDQPIRGGANPGSPRLANPNYLHNTSGGLQQQNSNTSVASGGDSSFGFLSGFAKKPDSRVQRAHVGPEGINTTPRPAGNLPYAATPESTATTNASTSSQRWVALYSIPPSATMNTVRYLDVKFGEVETYFFALERSPHDPGQAIGRRGVLYVFLREEFAAQRIVVQEMLTIPLPKSSMALDGEGSIRVHATWAAQPPAAAVEMLAAQRSSLPTQVVLPGNVSIDSVFTGEKLHQKLLSFIKNLIRQQQQSLPAQRSVNVVSRLRTGVLTMPFVDPSSSSSTESHVIVLPTPWYLSYYFFSTSVFVTLLWLLWHYL